MGGCGNRHGECGRGGGVRPDGRRKKGRIPAVGEGVRMGVVVGIGAFLPAEILVVGDPAEGGPSLIPERGVVAVDHGGAEEVRGGIKEQRFEGEV